MLELEVGVRHVLGKRVVFLRRQKMIPASIYGAGQPSQAIQVSQDSLQSMLKQTGRHGVVNLRLQGQDGVQPALLRQIQRHPTTDSILHVDFQRVSLAEKVRTEVALVLEGRARGVEEKGGVLVQNLHSLEVECLPQEIPPRIVVDVSSLGEIGDTIYVSDLPLPGGVRALAEGGQAVVHVVAPAKAEAAVAAPVEEAKVTTAGEESASTS
ncbi:MAG TPA: 50S ribosomal protein L25 [Dehalococcoidia bacterium]|nr:50S ribosomal protein L25 [Dehalococcoidia bacterium]